jgi:AcrR family transcriptional regulator
MLLTLSAANTAALRELGLAATFDDIAERAGVSRRTIHRYVDDKESLAFIHPMLWLDIFDEAVGEVADQPLRERLLFASHRISEFVDADPLPVREAMLVAGEHPSLAKGYAIVRHQWIDRMAAEILGDATDAESVFRSQVLGAAVMGVIDATLLGWAADPGNGSVDMLVSKGLDYLAPILDS